MKQREKGGTWGIGEDVEAHRKGPHGNTRKIALNKSRNEGERWNNVTLWLSIGWWGSFKHWDIFPHFLFRSIFYYLFPVSSFAARIGNSNNELEYSRPMCRVLATYLKDWSVREMDRLAYARLCLCVFMMDTIKGLVRGFGQTWKCTEVGVKTLRCLQSPVGGTGMRPFLPRVVTSLDHKLTQTLVEMTSKVL